MQEDITLGVDLPLTFPVFQSSILLAFPILSSHMGQIKQVRERGSVALHIGAASREWRRKRRDDEGGTGEGVRGGGGGLDQSERPGRDHWR